jgi:DNA primase
MRIGYAPGRCLRSWLTQLGYPPSVLRQAGLITAADNDTYIRCIIFPLETNLYGRSIRSSALPHRFMPGSKGGLYLWEQVRRYPDVILVEGLFDYAVLWQTGFRNITCPLGNHLNAYQFQHLCDSPRTVYVVFDAEANGSGPRTAQSLSRRLWAQGIIVRRVTLPESHDPTLLNIMTSRRDVLRKSGLIIAATILTLSVFPHREIWLRSAKPTGEFNNFLFKFRHRLRPPNI